LIKANKFVDEKKKRIQIRTNLLVVTRSSGVLAGRANEPSPPSQKFLAHKHDKECAIHFKHEPESLQSKISIEIPVDYKFKVHFHNRFRNCWNHLAKCDKSHFKIIKFLAEISSKSPVLLALDIFRTFCLDDSVFLSRFLFPHQCQGKGKCKCLRITKIWKKSPGELLYVQLGLRTCKSFQISVCLGKSKCLH
jgi:hypothetical protein